METMTDDSQIGHGVAAFDYDNDGSLDLYVASLGGYGILYKNPGYGNNWIQIKLIGVASNPDGFGSFVTVSADGNGQIKEHISSAAGHQSGNSVPLHFGLGTSTLIDYICIRWSSGQVQTIQNVNVNRFIEITEPCSSSINPGRCPFFPGVRTFANSAFNNMCNTAPGAMPYCYSTASCSYNAASMNTTCTCPSGMEGNGVGSTGCMMMMKK